MGLLGEEVAGTTMVHSPGADRALRVGSWTIRRDSVSSTGLRIFDVDVVVGLWWGRTRTV